MVLLLNQLVRTVVHLCYKIHDEGGIFLSDGDYIESVKYELNIRNLSYRQNEIVELEYLGKLVDRHQVEFIIEDKVLLDLKGKMLFHHKLFSRQLLSYIEKENVPVALVIDFHSRRLRIRKIINPNYNYQIREV